MTRVRIAVAVGLWVAAAGYAQQKAIEPDLGKVATGEGWKVFNRTATTAEEAGRKVARLDEKPGDGIAWLEGAEFGNGVIEVELKGRNVMQRSFLGVAFRVVDEKTYDAVYFRPFNFKNTDAARRNHAVQYISHPTYTWQKLRTERPETYEKPVNPAPDPDGYFRVRVEVARPKVRVFVDDAKEPCLTVDELSERTGGKVGLWVGNGSDGAFTKLRITPAK